ncbi:maleylpyruvate isomerase family mycothiol-dependent enzyme [Mycolicibacterium sp. XJ662]
MDFRAALLEQTRAFGELIRSADPSTPVPTCPEWTFKQLFRHVGRGTRWAAQIIGERRLTSVDPRDVRDGKPPDDPDAAIAWLNGGPRAVLAAVDRVGSERVWTATGPRPAGWWIRRLLHEAVVHRADAALAVGADYNLPVDLAADGISEWIELMSVAASHRGEPPLDRGRTLHLHATDDGLGPTGEWTVVNAEDGVTWTHDHGKGDVALRGPAKDLLLALARRRSVADAGIEVFGDEAVWADWLQRTPF